MAGVAMKSLRVPLPASSYSASLGLQSNFQIRLPVAGSKACSQPSPPGKTTCGCPLTTAYAGFDHWPCWISLAWLTSRLKNALLLPAAAAPTRATVGSLSCQTTLPLVLSTLMKLGALGDGT